MGQSQIRRVKPEADRKKTDKEIRETLTRRYKFAIRRLAQTNSEDVFSLAMTAFAREIDPHTNYLSRVIPNSSTLK